MFHCNEGHAAFIGIERIRDLVNHKKLSFSEALEVIRSSSLFTTHTPVPAGHDAFPESMIRQYMSHYPDVLGITWEQYINLGKTNPNDPNEKFSMSSLTFLIVLCSVRSSFSVAFSSVTASLPSRS